MLLSLRVPFNTAAAAGATQQRSQSVAGRPASPLSRAVPCSAPGVQRRYSPSTRMMIHCRPTATGRTSSGTLLPQNQLQCSYHTTGYRAPTTQPATELLPQNQLQSSYHTTGYRAPAAQPATALLPHNQLQLQNQQLQSFHNNNSERASTTTIATELPQQQ